VSRSVNREHPTPHAIPYPRPDHTRPHRAASTSERVPTCHDPSTISTRSLRARLRPPDRSPPQNRARQQADPPRVTTTLKT
jgi:hypothetical protein